ncbi:MAG: peptide/nickel transport system permease protein [Thermomicrobiales bacterium]|jgi:peptide/nickel transport system permease protein|nr:peptide/nickel transport system permease protein [Thermomicrobiales bacterium]MEA2583234.1 peptide/nickel transport system permease protein [Thermomicrobiales bacterium]
MSQLADTLTLGRAGRAPRSRWTLPRRWRNPIGIAGAVIVVLTVVVALAAPLIAPFEPDSQKHERLLGPSWTNLMGTDELGRDTFSRIIFGARVSLQVGIIAVCVALVIGGCLGVIAGYGGGRVDAWLMRVVDIMFAFPGLVLAIVIAGLLGASRTNAMIAIGVVYAPAFARVIRGSVLSVMSEPYVESGRVAGSTHWRLVRHHVVPNIVAPMIVMTTVYLSSAILSEAALSFLGLGTQPPEPSWGGMLNLARTYMEIAPWMAIFPGLAIMLVVLGFNFLGDGLRDVLDPRLRVS